jgi:hypothetical protein
MSRPRSLAYISANVLKFGRARMPRAQFAPVHMAVNQLPIKEPLRAPLTVPVGLVLVIHSGVWRDGALASVAHSGRRVHCIAIGRAMAFLLEQIPRARRYSFYDKRTSTVCRARSSTAASLGSECFALLAARQPRALLCAAIAALCNTTARHLPSPHSLRSDSLELPHVGTFHKYGPHPTCFGCACTQGA